MMFDRQNYSKTKGDVLTEEKVLYRLLEEELESEDYGRYVGYGIVVERNGHILRRISDISTERAKVMRLAEKCNGLGLDPAHLDEILEDYLVDLTV